MKKYKSLLAGLCLMAITTSVHGATYTKVGDVYYCLTSAPYSEEEGVLQAGVSTPDGRVSFSPGVYEGEITVDPFITVDGQKYAVTTVNANCFAYQSGVTAVTLPSTITAVLDNSFRETNITTIDLPAALEKVGSTVFSRCYGLTTVYCHAEQPPIAVSGFTVGMDIQDVTLYVPAGCVEAYAAADEWKKFGEIQVIPIQQTLPEEIILTPNEFSAYIGAQFQVSVGVLPDNADDKSYILSSTDDSVATVDQLGNVVLVGAGKCEIVATSNSNPDVSGICKVESIEDTRVFPEEIIIIPEEVTMPIGSIIPLNIRVLPVDTFDKSIDFQFLPEGIVTINENFEMELVALGQCFVTVRSAVDHKVGEILSVQSLSDVLTIEDLTYKVTPETRTAKVIGSEGILGNVLAIPDQFLPPFSERKIYIVDSVGENAFAAPNSIETLRLSKNIESIGVGAFAGCYSLEKIEIFAEIPPVLADSSAVDGNKIVFPESVYTTCEVIVPAGSLEEYRTSPIWENFTNIIPIGGGGSLNGLSEDILQNVKWYNLSGIPIENPCKGELLIKVTDGHAQKVVIK